MLTYGCVLQGDNDAGLFTLTSGDDESLEIVFVPKAGGVSARCVLASPSVVEAFRRQAAMNEEEVE